MEAISESEPRQTTLDAATEYTRRGWRVVPIPTRSKNPGTDGWQHLRLAESDLPEHFNGDPQNIGLLLGEPSGWTVDVDLDHPRAVALADQFLPDTAAVFGRAGKPRSHRLYRLTGPATTTQHRTKGGETIVELRAMTRAGTPSQTVIPPSIHPSGEPIEWESDGDAATVGPDELLAAVERIADAVRAELGEPKPKPPPPPRQRSGPLPLGNADRALRAMRTLQNRDKGDGSSRLYAAACIAVRFNLDDGQALEAVGSYLAECPTPRAWTDADILRRVRDAENKCTRGEALENERPAATAATTSAKHYPLTELGFSELLLDQHAGELRYCNAMGWLRWTGTNWTRDELGTPERLAKAVVREAFAQAARIEDRDTRDRMLKDIRKFEASFRIRGIVALAMSDPRVRVPVEVFDADPWRLNVANGTIDLRTGELHPHKPGDHITKLANVNYDPDADCPRFEQFIGEVFDGDSELVGFMQRAIGYALTGDTREQCLFLLYGTGSNGKSVLLLTLQSVLGSYAMQTDAATFMVKRTDAVRNDVARLAGSRLCTAIETEENQRLAESLVKQLTGGDKVTARFLFREHFEFTPAFKLVLAANHKPTINGQDFAIWRRIHLIPFNVTFDGDRADKTLAATLQAEASGVLNWALAGLRTWLDIGLQPPAVVAAATAEYKRESDGLADFIESKCIEAWGREAKTDTLYKRYVAHALAAGDKPIAKVAFGRRLGEKGFEPVTVGRARGWGGIDLTDDEKASMQAAEDAKKRKSATDATD